MREVVCFDVNAQEARLEELFIEYNHFRMNVPRYQKMMANAREVLERGRIGLQGKAVICTWDDYDLIKTSLFVEGEEIICKAFSELQKRTITGVYGYFMTVGKCKYSGEHLIEKLYADIWGTVYVDYVRTLLENYIKQKQQESLSPSYGPGYFGMNTEEICKLYQVIAPTEIGITVNERGMASPLKSCAGIYVASTKPECFPKSACASCKGIATSCTLCRLAH